MEKQVFVYFSLVQEDYNDDEASEYEQNAYEEIEKILSNFSTSKKLLNEGHNCHGALICCFPIQSKKIKELQNELQKLIGGGDDIIYLEHGFCAQEFSIVEKPGISKPIIFEDWK